MKGLRADYLEHIASFVLARVKFIDETGINVGLTRLYGRATPGVRVVEAVRHASDAVGRHWAQWPQCPVGD